MSFSLKENDQTEIFQLYYKKELFISLKAFSRLWTRHVCGEKSWGLVEDCSDRVIPSACAHALSVLGFLKQGIPAYCEE